MLYENIIVEEEYTNSPSEDFRFASSVVEFGLLLRNSEYKADSNYDSVIQRANDAMGDDEHGYRAEFVWLVQRAKDLD